MKRLLRILIVALLVCGWDGTVLAGPVTLDLSWCETQAAKKEVSRARGEEAAASEALLEESEAVSGWKIFGSSTLGTAREPVDEDSKRSYEYLNLKLGLRYPLFGSYQKEQEAIAEKRLQNHLAELRQEEDALLLLRDIRVSYVNLWADQRILEWTQAFLEAETLLGELLALRRDKGLLLEGDRREFMTMYALAHRNQARYRWQEETDLARLEVLTGNSLEQVRASYPNLPLPGDVTRVHEQVANHPRVMQAAYLVNEEQARHHTYNTYHIESGVNISQGWTDEFPGGTGFDTAVSIDFRMPWEFLKAGRARARYHHFTVRQQEATLREENQTLGQQAEEKLALLTAREKNLNFAEDRLSAAEENLRERFLRAGLLEGDTLEELQQGVFSYYQIGVDFYEAQRDLLQARVELLAIAPPGPTGPQGDQASSEQPHQPRAGLLGPQMLQELRRTADHAALDAAAQRLFTAAEESDQLADQELIAIIEPAIDPSAEARSSEEAKTSAQAPQTGSPTLPAVREPKPLAKPAKQDVAQLQTLPTDGPAQPALATIQPQALNQPEQRSAVPQRTLPVLGAYLWNGTLLLEAVRERKDPQAWAAQFKQQQPFTLILISLKGREIDQLSRDLGTRMRLAALLRALQQQGVRTDLLLGEPNWILDRYRGDLPFLLPKLADLPFQGLHLDLEPEQLKTDGLSDEELLNGLLATLRRVKEVSSWPLTISLHHRDPLKQVNGRPLAAQLAELGLERVVLMIYNSHPEKTAVIAEPILKDFPTLHFGIAQSVEPEPILSPGESYYRLDRNQLQGKLSDLSARLAGYSNFDLLLIQNYTYFQRLAP